MSDIFNEYAKLAVKNGLIKEAQEETNPRYDSLDLEAIEMLYGVKPNGKDEKHIVEQAHPEPAVVSPAYDRVNGLVENLLERQDVMHYIATKPNHGKHIQERYVKAHKELVDEVIKVAFILDRDDENELMAFADDCAEKLVKNARTWGDIAGGLASLVGPGALAWVLGAGPVGWAAAGATVGIIALINNFGGIVDQGSKANAEKAIEELEDVINDPEEGVGYDSKIQDMISDLRVFLDKHQEIDQMHISSIEENSSELPKNIEDGKRALLDYKTYTSELSNKINDWMNLLKAISLKDRESSEAQPVPFALLTGLMDVVWTSDVDDANTALNTFKMSLGRSTSAMSQLFSTVKKTVIKNKDKLQELHTKQTEESGKETTELPDEL